MRTLIQKLDRFSDIVGDDAGHWTTPYRKVPDGFRLTDLVFPPSETHPLSNAVKDKLLDFADRWYDGWEIVGDTYTEFHFNCQLALDEKVDNLEKFLEVYWDDIAKPTQSRTIKRTYNTQQDTEDSEQGSVTTDANGSNENSTNTDNTDYDIPLDNGELQGTASSKGTTTSTGQNTSHSANISTRSGTGKTKHTGTETEEWSDVGVAPNYELLNGFLDWNRSVQSVFVSYFYDCFTLLEGMYITR